MFSWPFYVYHVPSLYILQASILLHLQARQAESNVNQTENRTFPPLECINTATTTVGGGDLCGILPPEKVQKVWTCVICQVTAQSETALISHLHGKRHKATCEQLNVKNQKACEPLNFKNQKACEPLNFKNQASNSNVSPASVGRNLMKSRCIEMIGSHWFCTICNVSSVHGMQSHLKGKRHRASLQALDGLGGNRHAWVTEYVHTTIAEDVVLISRPRWPWSSKVPVD
jgi:hypothetical protein